MPAPADLLALCRGSHRALRPVGRRLDDFGAAVALPAVRDLWPRFRARSPVADRALVPALALRALAGNKCALRGCLIPLASDPGHELIARSVAWLALATACVT